MYTELSGQAKSIKEQLGEIAKIKGLSGVDLSNWVSALLNGNAVVSEACKNEQGLPVNNRKIETIVLKPN